MQFFLFLCAFRPYNLTQARLQLRSALTPARSTASSAQPSLVWLALMSSALARFPWLACCLAVSTAAAAWGVASFGPKIVAILALHTELLKIDSASDTVTVCAFFSSLAPFLATVWHYVSAVQRLESKLDALSGDLQKATEENVSKLNTLSGDLQKATKENDSKLNTLSGDLQLATEATKNIDSKLDALSVDFKARAEQTDSKLDALVDKLDSKLDALVDKLDAKLNAQKTEMKTDVKEAMANLKQFMELTLKAKP